MARKKKSKSKSKPKKKRSTSRKRRRNPSKKRKRVVRRKRRRNPSIKRKRVVRRKRRRTRNAALIGSAVQQVKPNAKGAVTLTKSFVAGALSYGLSGAVAILLNDKGRKGAASIFAKDKNAPTREDYIQGQALISTLTALGTLAVVDKFQMGKDYKVPILMGTGLRLALDVANAILPRTPKSLGAAIRRTMGLPLKVETPASMALNQHWGMDAQQGFTPAGEITQYNDVGGYESWGMAGYEDWGMAGYENWGVAGYESDLGTMSPGYEVGALPAAGHELGMMDDVGSMPVGHELSGNPYGNPYGGSANPFA